MFDQPLMQQIRDRFCHVDNCPYQGPRIFFENAGGSLTLKSVVEVNTQLAGIPDNQGRDNPASRELVRRALEELAECGSLATNDIDAAYETTWAVLHGLLSLRLLRPDYPFSDQTIELAFDMIERGLLRSAPKETS